MPVTTATAEDGTALPPMHNGIPAFYYWRPAVKVGELKHEAAGWELSITPERQGKWVGNVKGMRAAGHDVPIYRTHNEQLDPELRMGNVMTARVRDGWYEELHQYLGEKDRDTALRNKVSVGIAPSFKDAAGRDFGEAIVHSAIVPDPVQFGQGPAIRAASMGGGKGKTMDPITITGTDAEALIGLLGDGTTAANFAEKAKAALAAGKKATTDLSAASTQIATLKLSAGNPAPVIVPEAMEALAEADETSLDSLVSAGHVPPAVALSLKKALIRGDDGRPIHMSISAAPGMTRLSKAVITALKGMPKLLSAGPHTPHQYAPNPTVQTQSKEQIEAENADIKARAGRV